MLLTEYYDDQKNWVSGRMPVRKRKRSLFPAIHQSNKSSLHLDVTEAPRSETESPFLYCSNILSCGYEAGKWTSSWIQWGTASEGSPALWWWSWKLHHTLVWPISPDNSLWGTYRRMGQDPKKRVLNISVLREIFYYYFHNFLHGTGISSFARNPSYNF